MILKDQMHKIEQADQEENEREQEEKIKFQKKEKISKQNDEQARNIMEANLKNDVIKI